MFKILKKFFCRKPKEYKKIVNIGFDPDKVQIKDTIHTMYVLGNISDYGVTYIALPSKGNVQLNSYEVHIDRSAKDYYCKLLKDYLDYWEALDKNDSN